ncbi:hypothetical protein SRHO_G00126790 [Serrasalmus rhombeus]
MTTTEALGQAKAHLHDLSLQAQSIKCHKLHSSTESQWLNHCLFPTVQVRVFVLGGLIHLTGEDLAQNTELESGPAVIPRASFIRRLIFFNRDLKTSAWPTIYEPDAVREREKKFKTAPVPDSSIAAVPAGQAPAWRRSRSIWVRMEEPPSAERGEKSKPCRLYPIVLLLHPLILPSHTCTCLSSGIQDQ